ncbi:MAG: alpha/beta hydrolase [Planctomycetota bacterium]
MDSQTFSDPPQLVLLPGLGADADLFYPQIEHFGDRLWVYTGLSPSQLEGQSPSMDWAAQHCANIISTQMSPGCPYVLGGMSFGGSLAMQIASLLEPKPEAIVLISSNRTAETIPTSFRVNRFVGSLLPSSLIRMGLRTLSGVFSKREQLDEANRERLTAMANRAEIPSLLWGAAAVAKWKFGESDAKRLTIPLHQIHGRLDWVIPRHDEHVTEEIPDGRHLITWTHARQVNDFLEQAIQSVLPESVC